MSNGPVTSIVRSFRRGRSGLMRFSVVVALFMGVGLMFAPRIADSAQPMEGFADLVENLSPAVVNISTSQMVQGRGNKQQALPQFPPGSPFEDFFKDFFDGQRENGEGRRPRRVRSLGSGFIIDPAGVVVTNNHVISDADEITVTLTDGTEFVATVIGRDTKTDLAVLQIETDRKLPAVAFGDSEKARVGDWVITVGNPFGLGGSVSAGILSARGRNINAGPYDNFLQTDAPINRGNSGGPLFNLDGEVIGINTAIYSPSGGSIGIGFAIPSNLARGVIEQLREYGETRRGWLGVRIQTVTDEIAQSLGLDKTMGALVSSVDEDGPAKKAGINSSDVILSFDGKEVTEMRELPRIVADTPIGREVKVRVWRNGKVKTLNVSIEKLDESEAQELARSGGGSRFGRDDETTLLGMVLAPLDSAQRERFDIDDDVEGVLVLRVDGDSIASEDVRPGDVIAEVAQQPVRQPSDVAEILEKMQSEDRDWVLLYIFRDGNPFHVPLKIDDED